MASGFGLYQSLDGGKEWKEVPLPFKIGFMAGLWGTEDGSVIFCAGDTFDGTKALVISSRDRGLTWEAREIEGTQSIYTLWGTSASNVYAGGVKIYHYDGHSWQKMLMDAGIPGAEGGRESFFCYSISGAADGSMVYAGCSGGRIYVHEPSSPHSSGENGRRQKSKPCHLRCSRDILSR